MKDTESLFLSRFTSSRSGWDSVGCAGTNAFLMICIQTFSTVAKSWCKARPKLQQKACAALTSSHSWSPRKKPKRHLKDLRERYACCCPLTWWNWWNAMIYFFNCSFERPACNFERWTEHVGMGSWGGVRGCTRGLWLSCGTQGPPRWQVVVCRLLHRSSASSLLAQVMKLGPCRSGPALQGGLQRTQNSQLDKGCARVSSLACKFLALSK